MTKFFNIAAVLVLVFIAVEAVVIYQKFGIVQEINRSQPTVARDDRVVLGHRVDSQGTFQLVYKD